MTGEDIYNLMKTETDEEFSDDEQALVAMNTEFYNLLNEKDWAFLEKTATLGAGVDELTSITDLLKVSEVSVTKGLTDDEVELTKGNKSDRFNHDVEMDYYVDLAENKLVFRYPWSDYQRIVDYIYKPADITMATAPVYDRLIGPVLGYRMALAFKRQDADSDMYTAIKEKEREAYGKLIDFNESLYA